MRRGWHGAVLTVAVGLLAACQDNPPRPDAPEPVATTAPETVPAPADAAATEQPTADQTTQPAPGATDTDVAQVSVEELVARAEAAAPPKPKPAGKPRVSAKSAAYDRKGPAYSLLQAPRSALRNFPADSLGGIDWVSALEQGLIAPRKNLRGAGEMRRRDDAIIMRNTMEMPWVRFPHAEHTEWLDCSNCHPYPFKEQTGSNEITMDSIMRGRHCGMCHDRVAFSIFACERCHSIPHPGSPAAWW